LIFGVIIELHVTTIAKSNVFKNRFHCQSTIFSAAPLRYQTRKSISFQIFFTKGFGFHEHKMHFLDVPEDPGKKKIKRVSKNNARM